MPDVTGLDPVEVDNEVAVLAGDVVRDLVTRHEEEIEALVARAEEIEARAEAAERSVREHPGIALLDPDEAAPLLAVSPAPTPVDDGRPRTTVVRRSPPAGVAGARTDPSAPRQQHLTTPSAAYSGDSPPPTGGGESASPWWWWPSCFSKWADGPSHLNLRPPDGVRGPRADF